MRSVICLSAFIQQVAGVKGGHAAAPFFSLKRRGVGYSWVHSLSSNETREKAWGNNERGCWRHQPHLVFVCLGFQEMILFLIEQSTPVYLLNSLLTEPDCNLLLQCWIACKLKNYSTNVSIWDFKFYNERL